MRGFNKRLKAIEQALSGGTGLPHTDMYGMNQSAIAIPSNGSVSLDLSEANHWAYNGDELPFEITFDETGNAILPEGLYLLEVAIQSPNGEVKAFLAGRLLPQASTIDNEQYSINASLLSSSDGTTAFNVTVYRVGDAIADVYVEIHILRLTDKLAGVSV